MERDTFSKDELELFVLALPWPLRPNRCCLGSRSLYKSLLIVPNPSSEVQHSSAQKRIERVIKKFLSVHCCRNLFSFPHRRQMREQRKTTTTLSGLSSCCVVFHRPSSILWREALLVLSCCHLQRKICGQGFSVSIFLKNEGFNRN